MPKFALQFTDGHLIVGVGGLVLATLPGLEFGGPAINTPKVGSMKVAVTVELAAPTVTTQVRVVAQLGILQPLKIEVEAALAPSVTCVPMAKLALHVPGQLIPGGVLVTVPVPVPVTATGKTGPRLKVAVTD